MTNMNKTIRMRNALATSAGIRPVDRSRGCVLVATGLGPRTGDLLTEGHFWSRMYDAPLRVCHVLPDARPRSHPLFPGLDARTLLPGVLRDRVEADLRQRLSLLPGNVSAVENAVEVMRGAPAAKIAELAAESDARMVIVGGSRRGAFSRLVRPSVARALMRSLSCPILVVKGQTGDPREVLAGTDLRDPGLPVLQVALDLARRLNRRVTALHAVPPLIAIDPMGMPVAADWRPATPLDAELRMNAAIHHAGVAADAVVVHGAPIPSLLDASKARQSGLIVVGHRRRSLLPRVLEGSVSERVVSRAACSVLVVPLPPRVTL